LIDNVRATTHRGDCCRVRLLERARELRQLDLDDLAALTVEVFEVPLLV
jgi:hypothetical protein